MKKITVLLLVGLFAVSMLFVGVSCKEEALTKEAAEEAPAEEAEEVAEEAPTEEATEEVQEEEITITFWGWGPIADGVANVAAPAFTAENPNVTVEVISMGPWDLMDKFYAAMVSGEGLPDSAMLVRRVMAKYLIPELLYDFTDFVNVEHEGEFIEAFNLDVTSPNGKILAVAPDHGPSVLYYNSELAESLGVNVEEIVTWDDYYDICMEVGAEHPDIYLHQLAYPGGSWGTNNWRLWIQSAGLNIFDEEGKVIQDNEELKEVNRFFYKLHSDVNVIAAPVNDPSIYDAFREGKVLFWPGTSYRSMEIAQQVPEMEGIVSTVPWPLWSEDAPALSGNWGGTGMVVPKKGPNVEIAAEFIKFLTTNQEVMNGIWLTSAGVPTNVLIRENILNMTDSETYATNLIESIVEREVSPWRYLDWQQTEKILGDNLDAMMAGDVTPDEMWDNTEAQLIKILGR